MGVEAACRVRLNDSESEGKAYCGDGEVGFRGDFRFLWKWTELASVKVGDGRLILRKGKDTAVLELGAKAAEKWCHSILNPKSRLDKLGLKPNHVYQAWGEFDDTFAMEVEQVAGKPGKEPLDAIFIQMNTSADLEKLKRAKKLIAQNGMIWAIWPKGCKEFRDVDIRDYVLKNGLVDIKVASFSTTLSALKLVIPLKARK